MRFWDKKRTVVTGGAGFLGGFVVGKLTDRGADVFVPRHRDYDLTNADETRRMYREARPQVVIHLAASVGGIRANQNNPGRVLLRQHGHRAQRCRGGQNIRCARKTGASRHRLLLSEIRSCAVS